jgi:hypothetical protein
MKRPDPKPCAFIDEEIQVQFDHPPLLSKKPDAPARFIWREEAYHVAEVLSTWFDYARRGRLARNMRQPHLRVAERRGSWGVGRFFFRVRCIGGRIFDLYFDRAPNQAADRAGHWFLWRELAEAHDAHD